MESQQGIEKKGGTMRLGSYDCKLIEGTHAAEAYGTLSVAERHRHRFEFNNEYKDRFEAAGMQCVGENPDTGLVEAVEVSGLRWFVGVQYHPEYTSTVLSPNPLFMGFIKAAINK